MLSARRGKCVVSLEVDAVRTKPRGQGVVDLESAFTAEGSTRIVLIDEGEENA